MQSLAVDVRCLPMNGHSGRLHSLLRGLPMNKSLHQARRTGAFALSAVCAGLTLTVGDAGASSHREAPFIAMQPSVDGTDLYLFRSYETGRQGFVTVMADYIPF